MNYITSRDQFNDAINQSDVFALCVFSADWCGPCKMLSPIIEQFYELCKENNSAIDVIKVNIDEFRDLAVNYNVNSVPTIMLFKDGRCIADRSGFVSLDNLCSWVYSNL